MNPASRESSLSLHGYLPIPFSNVAAFIYARSKKEFLLFSANEPYQRTSGAKVALYDRNCSNIIEYLTEIVRLYCIFQERKFILVSDGSNNLFINPMHVKMVYELNSKVELSFKAVFGHIKKILDVNYFAPLCEGMRHAHPKQSIVFRYDPRDLNQPVPEFMATETKCAILLDHVAAIVAQTSPRFFQIYSTLELGRTILATNYSERPFGENTPIIKEIEKSIFTLTGPGETYVGVNLSLMQEDPFISLNKQTPNLFITFVSALGVTLTPETLGELKVEEALVKLKKAKLLFANN